MLNKDAIEETAKKTQRIFLDAILVGKIKVVANGHFPDDVETIKADLTGKSEYPLYGESLFPWYDFISVSDDRPHFMPGLLENPLPPEKHRYLIGQSRTCEKCGETIVWETDGREVRCIMWQKNPKPVDWADTLIDVDAPCPMAAGTDGPITARIEVPSGKLVLANNMHKFFTDKVVWGNPKKQYDRKYNISTHAGQINYVKKHAEAGLLTGFVGSFGCDVFVSAVGVVVGKAASKSELGYHNHVVTHDRTPHTHVAHISTGLWWYGAADYDRCKELNPTLAAEARLLTPKSKRPRNVPFFTGAEAFVVEVEPGTYEMSHRYHAIDNEEYDDWRRDRIYSTIREVS
jgi:hypothetical protein